MRQILVPTIVLFAFLTGAMGHAKADTRALPAAIAAKDIKEEELDKDRAKLISPVPQSNADYTLGIDPLRPGWEGMDRTKVQKDYFGKGVDGMEVQTERYKAGHAMYWRIGKVEAGEYYVGLWASSYSQSFRTEYGPPELLASAYLNGWPVRFSTSTDPIQVRRGVWLAELQSAKTVKLKEGDEIAVWPVWGAQTQCFLRLALYRKEPVRGHGVTGQTFGADFGNPQRLRLVLMPQIKGSGQDGTEHEAAIEIANPLPYAIDAEVTWKLADYYGAPVEQKTEPLHLDAHAAHVISRKFTANGDAHAYQLDVKTRPAPGFKFPVPRPVEMMDMSDYMQLEFRPNLPDPLTVWNHTRMDLVDDRTGQSQMLCLDGNDWQWAYLDGRRVPATVPEGLVYGRATVPQESWAYSMPRGRFGTWFRKSFVVPAWMKGQRYILELSKLESEATFFLNGQRVGYGVGAMPLSVDVTKAIKIGQPNELIICVRGAIATVRPDYVDLYDSDKDRGFAGDNADVFHAGRVKPCLRSVYLCAAPDVRVTQSLVVADAEQGKLRIMTRLENDGDQPRQVTLRFEAFQNGKALSVPIPEKNVTVPPNGAITEVSVDAPAGDLTPWTQWNPVLARMTTSVVENGKVLNTFDRRFGYRDLKIKGTGLFLNGKPVGFIGGCNGPAPSDVLEGDSGVNFLRTPAYGVPDLWDEIGVPYMLPFDLGGDFFWATLNNDKYWNSYYHQSLETVWNEGSHPGVVGWDLCNETFYTIYLSGKEGQVKCFDRIHAVAQEMRKKIWPFYFCVADGDGSLGGRLDFASYHYWDQYSGTVNPEEGGFTYSVEGALRWSPDGFFINGAAKAPVKGTVLHMTPDFIYGSMACGSTEDFEFFGHQNGVPMFSQYIGDRAAISGACTANDPRGMAWTKLSLDGNRDAEEAIAGAFYAQNFYGAANPLVSFCMPPREIRYYSGARFDHRIDIFDDEYLPGKLDFQWNLLDSSGKAVLHGKIQAQSNTSFLKRDNVAFDVPQVSRCTRFTLDMELSKDGVKWAHEDRIVDVWPALESSAEMKMKTPVRVFDPNKALLPCLEKLGCPVKQIDSLDAASLAGAKALVIGPDCVTRAMAEKWPLVRDFARDGGRVLILRQDDASLLPLDVTIEPKAWKSTGFIRASKHPVMVGLQDMDFHMWNPGHVMAKGAFRNPDKGAFLTLVDSGHDDRTAWADMLEFYFGQGSILASQLKLTEDFNTEPMAAELLKRMVAYLDQPVFRGKDQSPAGAGRPDLPMAVLSGASDAVLKRLTEVRANYVIVADAPNPEHVAEKDSASPPVTLIDLGVDNAPIDAAAWRAYAQQGGTVLVHRATPRDRAWLESLTGGKVSVQVQPYKAWEDRQMLLRRDGLATGLSNLDLYWRTQTPGEGPGDYWQVSCGVEKGTERGQVQYVVSVEGAKDYLFPGGLLEVPVGKGRVVIDQAKWEMSDKDMVSGSPARCISVLLTNLGVTRRLPVPKPTLPKDVTYESIDISTEANRGFKDDKAGDGIGWLDWGPDMDIRSFPTGKISLDGVPYLVPAGDKNAIVLRSEVAKPLEKFPQSVTIPVNKSRVAGLLFLHTGGWIHGLTPFAQRQIEYADGTKEIIPLNVTNMGDWNPGWESFPNEEGTTTTVAWRGANERYPVIRVYQTLWVNPHPEKTIKQVVVSDAGQDPKEWRFVAHLGVTAAILPPDSNLPAAAHDSEKSRALFIEASALIDKKQTKEAAAKLQAAIDADDQNTAAWTALTDIRAKTDNIDAFTKLCERWAKAMPKNYQPHNVLGKYLEGKDKLAEALAEYRKSMEIEVNQPPVWSNIERLEKKMKEK